MKPIAAWHIDENNEEEFDAAIKSAAEATAKSMRNNSQAIKPSSKLSMSVRNSVSNKPDSFNSKSIASFLFLLFFLPFFFYLLVCFFRF
jgi:hypothetical protein